MAMSPRQPTESDNSGDQGRQDFLDYFARMTKTEDSSNKVFDSQQRQQDFLSFIGKMNKTEDMTPDQANVFDSVDFNNFLQHMQSKDASLNTIDFTNVFKSKESIDFSLFKSKEFLNSVSNKNSIPEEFKASSTPRVVPKASTLAAPSATSRHCVQQSQDWIKLNTLGQYVEVPYSTGMFSSALASARQRSESLPPPESSPSIRTDFSSASMMQTQTSSPNSVDTKKRKKRKRAPRKKIVPDKKVYTEPSEKDVLMGRGGKSNHHPGNARYRAEVERLQEFYKLTDDKDEKTKISESLVVYVQSYGGNFLEKDETGWYVIDDVVARRKVSQALREDKDPEKRRAKRQRFLEKKARMEEEARKRGA